MSMQFPYQWTADEFKLDFMEVPLRWICKGVANEGFSFAKEIHVHRVIVERRNAAGVVQLEELRASDFKHFLIDSVLESGTTNIRPEYSDLFEYGRDVTSDKFYFYKQEPNRQVFLFNRHNFNGYRIFGKAMPFVCKKWSEEHPLFVFSSLSFGAYGVHPPHEFSGLLKAARIMPSIWFGTMDEEIVSVRFDFRFHLQTDDNDAVYGSHLRPPIIKPKATVRNFASIIRDTDSLKGISCFSELVLLVGKLMDKIDILNEKFDEFRLMAIFSFTTVGVIGPLKLLDKIEELIQLITDIQDLFGLINKQLDDIPECVKKDQDSVMADAFQVLVGHMRSIIPNILSYVIRAVQILENEKAISKRLDAESDLELIEILTWYLDLEDQWKKVLDDRQGEIRKQIEQLRQENQDLEKLIERDLQRLLQQFMFLAGKIFNFINFDAIEKPVQHEMVGNFVIEGQVNDTWDNLHWWGTNFLPSAPGAFHAIHQHFRWSRFIADPSGAEEFATVVLFYALAGRGAPISNESDIAPFRSQVAAFRGRSIGGPLIDPHLPQQTIRFGVVKNGGQVDVALHDLAVNKTFEDVEGMVAEEIARRQLAGDSEDRFEGSDIVYWLSIQADRIKKGAFKGTLLINGFYFAHDLETAPSIMGTLPTNFAAVTRGTSATKPPYGTQVNLFRKPFLD